MPLLAHCAGLRIRSVLSERILETMIAIGNGESRLEIDIDRITDAKVGCNAIIREHTVEHLVCVDKRMLKECVQYSINAGTIYTRLNHLIGDSKVLRTLPELPYTGS